MDFSLLEQSDKIMAAFGKASDHIIQASATSVARAPTESLIRRLHSPRAS
jgi:hypothetical protein